MRPSLKSQPRFHLHLMLPTLFASQPPNPSVKGTSRKRAAPYVER